MVSVISPPEERMLLHDVSWETYEQLLANYADSSGPRFTYDRGVLEIMSPSSEHEEFSDVIRLLVYLLAEEWDINVRGFGSTTFRRADVSRGVEPDSCYYIKSVNKLSGVSDLDLNVHPPPDLVVEIDMTHPSISKLPIYAAFGVPEIWHYENDQIVILKLQGGKYVKSETSIAFPRLSRKQIGSFMELSKTEERPAWQRAVRKWARTAK
jgi:Uma2 family endonuclease